MKKRATIERIREVLDYDPKSGSFIWKKREEINSKVKTWNKRFSGKNTGCKVNIHGRFCMQISVDGKIYSAHRLAWVHFHGYWPKGEIDHINMDPCDNRLSNLREASRSQNECNKKVRADNKLGIKGVYFDNKRNKYMVQLKCQKTIIKKRVESLEEAKFLYQSLAQKYHGEFMRIS